MRGNWCPAQHQLSTFNSSNHYTLITQWRRRQTHRHIIQARFLLVVKTPESGHNVVPAVQTSGPHSTHTLDRRGRWWHIWPSVVPEQLHDNWNMTHHIYLPRSLWDRVYIKDWSLLQYNDLAKLSHCFLIPEQQHWNKIWEVVMSSVKFTRLNTFPYFHISTAPIAPCGKPVHISILNRDINI